MFTFEVIIMNYLVLLKSISFMQESLKQPRFQGVFKLMAKSWQTRFGVDTFFATKS